MIIREYKESDFPEIMRVIQATDKTDCWPKVFPYGWSEGRIREEFAPMKDYKDSCFFISEDNGRLTGLIAGHELLSFVENEVPHLRERFQEDINLDYYQRDIIVHPNFQRGWVGLKLFRKMVEYAKAREYKRVVTRTPPLNSRGIKFFFGVGYRELFRDNNPERIYFWRDLK